MTDWTHTILKKTGCIGSYLIAAVILLFCSNASSVVSQTGHSSPNNGIQALTISSSSRAGAEAPRTETTSSRLRTSRRGNESRSRASTAPLKTLLQPSCIRIDFLPVFSQNVIPEQSHFHCLGYLLVSTPTRAGPVIAWESLYAAWHKEKIQHANAKLLVFANPASNRILSPCSF